MGQFKLTQSYTLMVSSDEQTNWVLKVLILVAEILVAWIPPLLKILTTFFWLTPNIFSLMLQTLDSESFFFKVTYPSDIRFFVTW